MRSELAKGIDTAYRERSELLVFALTGRTGSGCTTAAIALCKPLDELALSDEGYLDPERRKIASVLEFARANWSPFLVITVSSVIFSFLIEESWADIERFMDRLKLPPAGRLELGESHRILQSDARRMSLHRTFAGTASSVEQAEAWLYFSEEVHGRAQQTRKVLAGAYQPLFQSLGDNIRLSGRALDQTIDADNLFVLMYRVRRLLEAATIAERMGAKRGARVVIDAVRNPLELVYLRQHFAGLYVIAVTVGDDERRARLMHLGLSRKEVDRIDHKEYGLHKQLDSYTSFVSQNLRECIQKADIFIENPGRPADFIARTRALNVQLVRYVALALRPGIVTPTRDERCMQIAFVSKLNSGCISRQVGAAVADSNYSIQAIGWNDTPKGQVPCLLRDVGALLSGRDTESFSDYEQENPRLREHLKDKFEGSAALRQESGLRCPYCFKDAYNTVTKEKNQVHTRSLHAEENAFLQLAKRGGPGIDGGVLYTTASPCELCSKKAYQLGIKEIVYVDPYPGISASHILASGSANARPALRLFGGAVGHAYHRLYESILPIKDEFGARLGK
jgi:deoxycytidylate deaminase